MFLSHLGAAQCDQKGRRLEEYEQSVPSLDFQHSFRATCPDNREPLTQPVILEALDDPSVTCVEIAEHLTSLGLRQHLLFAVDRTEAHMRTIINRFSLLLKWLLDTKPSFKKYTLCTLQLCIKAFITEEYGYITDYVKYLSDNKHYQCSTVISHLDDIRICVFWFALHRGHTSIHDSRVDQRDLIGMQSTVKMVRKILSKKDKKRREKNRPTLVEHR